MKKILCFLFGHKLKYYKNQYGIISICQRCGFKSYLSYKRLSKIIGEPIDPIVPMPNIIQNIMSLFHND